jgi:plasmid stabilization system protein ParE
MTAYVISPTAKGDLKDIRDYLWDQATRKVAARVLNELRLAMVRIAELPGVGHRRVDLAGEEIRFYRVFQYLIIYRDKRRPIEIVRVLHGARDVKRILDG